MWLIKVGYSSEHEGHQIYQCKVCNTKLLVPIVELPNSNSIERKNWSPSDRRVRTTNSSRGMAFLQFGEPLPGLSHFSQPLTMRRRRGLRHVAAFNGLPKKFLDFFQRCLPFCAGRCTTGRGLLLLCLGDGEKAARARSPRPT